MALELGVQDIELDVRLSRDGVPVVFHDEALDRTTNGTGPLHHHSLTQLDRLDAGAWFGPKYAGERIPTLDQVLERYRDKAFLHIELKVAGSDMASRLASLLQKHNAYDATMVVSFHEEALLQVKGAAPEERLGWLVTRWDEGVITQAKDMGVQYLCPLASAVTPALVDSAHAKGLAVRTWAVKSDQEILRMFQCGVDGMTLDAPDRALSISRITVGPES